MRYSRFKQAMEGIVPSPRRRSSTTRNSRRPRKAIKAEKDADTKDSLADAIKSEPDPGAAMLGVVKEEPAEVSSMANLSMEQAAAMAGPPPFFNPTMTAPASLPPEPQPLPMAGPSRREFGPFAGSYPPPGVAIPQQQEQPEYMMVKMETQHEQPENLVVKAEPRWE